MRLQELPLVLLSDTLLPHLGLRELLSLASASREFHNLIFGEACEQLWKRRLIQDLNFPPHALEARRGGHLDLYRRATGSELWVWGDSRNGRLGLSGEQHSGSFVSPPQRVQLPKGPLVSIKAGGWCTVVLNTDGKMLFCGQMDGSGWASASESFANPYKAQRTFAPVPLSLPRISQVEIGRSHLVAHGTNFIIEMSAFGCADRLHDRRGRFQSGSTTRILCVAAGWNSSAVLTGGQKRAAFIWQAPAPAEERSSILAVTDRLVDAVELPSLPEEQEMDSLALTEDLCLARAGSAIYRLDTSLLLDGDVDAEMRRERFDAAVTSRQLGWQHLPHFSGASSLSAQFKQFVVLQPASHDRGSEVLLGDRSTAPSSQPCRVAHLDDAAIVDAAQGDHHKVLLTEKGRCLTFGETSQGRLGRSIASAEEASRPLPVEVPGFVFAIAASGWHSACLVLPPDARDLPAAEQAVTTAPTSSAQHIPPFRLGLAAAGVAPPP